MNEERTACEQAHAAFFDAYPELVAASAPARLARLFDETDFPSPSRIRRSSGSSWW